MLRRLPALAVALVVLAAAAAAVLWFVPSDHYIVLPDRARPVDPLVEVPGEEGARDGSGIYMVDVRVGRASLLERFFPGLREGATLLPEDVLNPEGISDRQRRRSSLNEMSRSQKVAIAVALRELGREVDVDAAGAEVVLVQPGSPADGTLQVGDVVLEAREQPVRTTNDLRTIMGPVEPGESVRLTVERDGEEVELTVGTRESQQAPPRAVMGVQVQDAQEFSFPLDVEIDAGSIGGPSAGLAFALDIVDELGREVDGGRRVVATGEITLAGDVRAVGGIPQKTIGARDAEADVFLVPDLNAAEARRYAGDLEIVAVSDFDEALSALATH
ncbi:MAG TPA: PDZ domain-containing protein [Gaiellaceae bacterium]|nr:PDZ domain-containing protein [Gaiellaceae bacterium]